MKFKTTLDLFHNSPFHSPSQLLCIPLSKECPPLAEVPRFSGAEVDGSIKRCSQYSARSLSAKIIISFALFAFSLAVSLDSFSQCATLPDDCSTACNLGTLPTPPACNGNGNTTGAVQTFNLTNTGATASSGGVVSGCAYPAADVWYTFTATGTELDLIITSALHNVNVSLYQGNNCNSLEGVTCFSSPSGNLNQTFSPITPGNTYYLQISGGYVFDQGNFTLKISNNLECNNCVLNKSLTVTPPPVNGTYGPGQTVSFCFSVLNYNEGASTNGNYLHGVVLSFGAGWDSTTLTAVSIPASCATTTDAHWGFYARDSSTSTDTIKQKIYGPGFFYETYKGHGSNVSYTDSVPGDNQGDGGVEGTTCQPVFCWKITTKSTLPCPNNASLIMSVKTTGDSQSGDWNVPGCQSDPVENFNAILSCCSPPLVTVINTGCGLNNNGGAIATGMGVPPFHYVWTNSAGIIIASDTGIYGSDTLLGLSRAQYFVTVFDSTNCSNTGIATIGTAPQDTFNIPLTTISCFATSPGDAKLTLTPKYPLNGPYMYSLDNGPFQSSSTFTNLGVKLDTIYVTDRYGCHDTVTASITRPPLLVIDSAALTPVTCNIGGTITVYAHGGTGAYNYLWSQNLTGNPVTGLSADTYQLTLTDQNQCTDSASYTIINGPNAIVFGTPVINGITCHGQSNGSISLHVTGVGSVHYSWSNGDTTSSITGLINTTYYVNVRDSAGCIGYHTYYVPGPQVLLINTAYVSPVSCSGPGSIDLFVTGGTTAYTYNWSNSQHTDSIGNLSVGPYQVTVVDQNSCSTSASYNIISTVYSLSISTPDISNLVCYGDKNGSIAINATGGVGTYTYRWNNNDSTFAITGLTAGSYTVVAKDSNNCSVTGTFTVTQPLVISPNLNYQRLLCYDSVAERISVNPSGGTPGYTYLWNDSSTRTSIEHSLGKVEVTVTDSKNCFVVDSGNIIGMDTQIYNTNILTLYRCIYPAKGDLQLDGRGGTGFLTYNVSGTGSDTTGVFKGLAPGNYFFTITDTNGCTQNGNVTIPPSIANDSFAIRVISPACYGDNTGEIIVTPENPGDGPFQYQINGEGYQQDTIFNNLTPGVYNVEAQNYIFGCTYNLSATIQAALPLLTNSVTDTIYTGPGIARPITLDTSAIENLIYDWSPTTGLTCSTCAGLSVLVDSNTVYVVTVMDTVDNKNCAVSDTFVVIVSPPDTLVMPMAFTPNGDGRNDLFEPVPSIKYGVPTIVSFKIYNRWGELVHNSDEAWDGKFNGHPQPVGTYIYYIEVREIDPNNSSGGTRTLKQQGAVTLLR